MDKPQIETLLTLCDSDTERAELSSKYNAYIKWLNAHRADATRENLAQLDAAKKSLKETVREIEGRADAVAADAAPLANRMAAVGYLKNQGWKIGKSKLFADSAAGLLKVNADGTINEAEAIAYAHRFLKKVAKFDGGNDDLYREKAEAELELSRARADKIRFDTDKDRGLYLLKIDVEREIAVKIGLFEAGFKNAVRIEAEDLIHKVGGDPNKAQMFCTLFYGIIDRLLGEFADMPEIRVLVRKIDMGGNQHAQA